ncbi:type III-B CRISPR module-associated protein Cmr5 [Roseibium suaedae]|uniref:Uncharacterized protein n=1 Tax=Roseibium suaedae TaxID=735517 RepID=A0A1M7BIU4_9HYPH|nr:type III-B CRISPR module-associated protein Cmr5 [Roseibium suaedae]SHL54912.1 hypothetical protein SAMN05444272_0856 [Roseibium suaedae]
MAKTIQTIDYPEDLKGILTDGALKSAFLKYCQGKQLLYAFEFAFKKPAPKNAELAKTYYKAHYASGARALPALLQHSGLCTAAAKLAQGQKWDAKYWKPIHAAARAYIQKELLTAQIDDFYKSDSFTPAHHQHFTKKYKASKTVQEKLGVYKSDKLLNQFIASLVTSNGQATALATKLIKSEKMLQGNKPADLINAAQKYLPE